MSNEPEVTEVYELRSEEAARLLGVHADTLRRWADEGKISFWRTPGGQRRYRRSEVVSLLPDPPAA